MNFEKMSVDSLISIIIPTYNRAHLISNALDSIIDQTYTLWECIIVDDGSTDNTEQVIQVYSEKHPNIRLIKLQHNGNANIARNKGIKEARGRYISMLDSDDIYLPFHLQRRIEKITQWDCDGIYGSFILDDLQSKTEIITREILENELTADFLLEGNFAVTPSHFYKRNCILETLWDESYIRHQDYDLLIRFRQKFTIKADMIPTVIVKWEKSIPRNFHFPSMIKFIEQYKDQMKIENYCNYCLSKYQIAKDNNNESQFFFLKKIKENRKVYNWKVNVILRVFPSLLSKYIKLSKR